MNICIIFNPAARGERAGKFRQQVEHLRGDYSLKPTTGPGAARNLASEAVREGYDTIIAAGGDGTLNEVLNGIADVPGGFERTRLGVMPLGTINVFARELRLPLKFEKLWPMLREGGETVIDLGLAEYQRENSVERRYFLQLAGAGYDARSVELVNWELKKKVGPAAYVVAGLQALARHQPSITISNGTEEQTGELILIGNGKFYGGSFPIFHKGDLRDGLLDAVVFPKVNWQSLPKYGWDFLTGRAFREGGSVYMQGAEFMLRGDSRSALQLEGELVGDLPAKVTVVPRRLRVVVPNLEQALP